MNTLTIIGNLGADPELRFTKAGKAVATLRVADTPRHKNAAGDWVDGETLWMRVNLWERAAEAAAEELRKGDGVMAVGRLTSNSYTDKDGNKRESIEMTADRIAKVVKPSPVQAGFGSESAPF
jgi:single-strand DNA-binding protein